MPRANYEMYQMKVTLEGTQPPVWRRFLALSDITLYRLHLVLQEAMGWTNSHLHLFIIGAKEYGDPEIDEDSPWGASILDERKAKLNQLIKSEKSSFTYEYDFGDGWQHAVLCEKILPNQASPRAVCLAGARACPPEDCGGIGGYEELVEAMKNPRRKRYKELVDWLGEEFDAEAFDLKRINSALKRLA